MQVEKKKKKKLDRPAWHATECENLLFFPYRFSIGLVLRGNILLNAGFVSLDLQFNVAKEPKLNLNSDVEFSVENMLCMQLSQPNDVFT